MSESSTRKTQQTTRLTGDTKLGNQPSRVPLTFNRSVDAACQVMFQFGNDVVTTVRIAIQGQLSIGRADVVEGYAPGLDLGAYGGQDAGVSRRHAMISVVDGELHIRDLASTNGTRINGFVLAAEQPYKLSDGDELEFGELRTTIRILPR